MATIIFVLGVLWRKLGHGARQEFLCCTILFRVTTGAKVWAEFGLCWVLPKYGADLLPMDIDIDGGIQKSRALWRCIKVAVM
ncbi:hypothetical protein LguiA_007720 [Lonicera macranthoides]